MDFSRPDNARLINRLKILSAIREKENMTRAELSREILINKVSISEIVDSLIKEGLVRESGKLTLDSGRPATLLDIDVRAGKVIGLVIREKGCLIAASDLKGKILRLERFPRGEDEESLKRNLSASLERILRNENVKIYGAVIVSDEDNLDLSSSLPFPSIKISSIKAQALAEKRRCSDDLEKMLFIMVSEGDYVETTTEWTEYSYKLPDNARYFAIHCVSEDASLFKLDDISYTLDYGSKIAQATGYELYLNGELLRSVAATDSSFTFEDLPDGSHDLGLRALYEEGASDMVTRTVTIGYEVPAPVDVEAHLTDTGWLLTWDMPGGLNAQYYKVFCDGEFVINTQYKQWFLGELQENEGHYAGVCAVVNEYFSDTIYTKFGKFANEGMNAGLTAKLYPNPAHQTFYLEVDEACVATLFSADGKKVLSRELTVGKHEFKLEGQTNGVYLISIETAKGITFKKLILQ